MQKLLDEIGILNLKYEKLKGEDKFNIFPLLRSSYDEVNLHSKFIYELLNPEGTHKEGNGFLKSFLETIGIQNFKMDDVGDGVQVYREHQYIDILITNNRKQAIVIENKIWAEDQDKQLQRYYEQMKNQGYEKIWLIYLTLHGNEPNNSSIGGLPEDVKNELITISYSDHILQWLEKCTLKSARKPLLRETIIQYENLIKEITGNTMNEEEVKEVYDLLAQGGGNIHKAHTIASNWNHVRWYLEWNFWSAFEDIISQEYDILDIQKYSDPALTSVIHYSRNRNPWFGIMFKLFSKGEDTFCIFIERGTGCLCYGITLVSNGERGSKEKHDEYAKWTTELEKQKLVDWPKDDDAWLGGKNFKTEINFEALTPNTLNLIEEEKRKEFIENSWAEIKEFIEQVKKIKI